MATIHHADLIGRGQLAAHAVVIHAASSKLAGDGGMARVPAAIRPANDAEPHRQYQPRMFLKASPEVFAAAKSYIDKDNAIIAVWLDGKAKRPWDWLRGGIGWRERRFTKDEILYSLNNGCQGIGWPGGEINHFVTAIDFDTKAGDEWWYEQCKAAGIDPDDYPTVITPGKIKPDGSRVEGRHRYVRDVRGTLGNSNAGKLKELGIDIRGRGFAVLPPSPHPDGGTYKWVPRHTLDDFPDGVPVCPDFFYEAAEAGRHKSRGNSQDGNAGATPDDRVYAYCRTALNNARQRLAQERPGNRNAALNIAALKLGHYAHYGAYDENEARAALRAACVANGYMSEHSAASFDATFDSGWGKGLTEPKELEPEPPQPKLNVDPAPWPEPLAEAAYHGPAGEFVRLVAPQSESDPAALLVTFLAGAGNLIGRGPHARVEDTEHHANVYAVVVGDTAKARKGTSLDRVRKQLSMVEESKIRDIQNCLAAGRVYFLGDDWHARIQGGLSSGEGLIWAVRDRITKMERVKDRTTNTKVPTEVEVDAGVYDKRLFAVEPEFAGLLKVMERQGNTISRIVRDAWDRGNLASMTKNSPARATGAHVSILGHITVDELRRSLTTTECANGFANRFIYCCAQRSKSLPLGGELDEGRMAAIARKLEEAVARARMYEVIGLDDAARELWIAEYGRLSAAQPGVFGAVTARAEAQVLRLALIYTLLDGLADGVAEIGEPHLRAAMALWSYAEASARHIFGDALGDPTADRIIQALRQAGAAGMTRTEINKHLGGHIKSAELDRALSELVRHGRAHVETRQTAGPSEEHWYAGQARAAEA
jgi:hypothetical protein